MFAAFLAPAALPPHTRRQRLVAPPNRKRLARARARVTHAVRPLARMSSDEAAAARGAHARDDAPLTADLDHVALACTGDPERLLSFYTGTLGFAPCNVERYRAGALPFPSARVNARTIIDFFPPALDGPGPGLARASHMCFAVLRAAFERLRARLDAHGVRYSRPSDLRSGARGDAHTMYFRDPDENLLEFRYYDAEDAQ